MLYKPTLLEVAGFNAEDIKSFEFVVPSGGDLVTGSRLIIQTLEEKNVVYDKIETRYNYIHDVPPKTLKNGVCYTAVLITINSNGEESKPSDAISFCCYETPILVFTNIPSDRIIKAGSFRFDFTYSQTQGDSIESFVMNLYNVSNVLVASSGRVYTKTNKNVYNGYYIFNGLDDKATYNLELVARSKSGTKITAIESGLNVKYKLPNIFTLLKLENNCDEGYITVTSNLIPIDGKSNPAPPIYINGKEVDLTQYNSYVQWDNGYNINDDMLVRVWFRKPKAQRQIINFSNLKGENILIEYMEGYKDVDSQNIQSYVQITVSSIYGLKYYIFTNYIDVLPESEYYNLQLKRQDNIYQAELIKVV